MKALAASLVLGLVAGLAQAAETKRTIVGLYDSTREPIQRYTLLHTAAEMPLNHIGLTLELHDIAKGFPDLRQRPDVRGAVTWFQINRLKDPREYIDWAGRMLDGGIKLVILGEPGTTQDEKGRSTPVSRVNAMFARMGFRADEVWTYLTYASRPAFTTTGMMDFERPLGGVLPDYRQFRPVSPTTVSHLVMRRGNDPATDSHLVMTGPGGGFVSPGYALYFDGDQIRKQWYLNPFVFFEAALGTAGEPRPDIATLNGRRIYFSHIDGDGWRNVSAVKPYHRDAALSAEVILKEVAEAYPDLPLTVAPIAADLDPAWFGTDRARELAQAFFALPHVEPASHTYTHPFFWSFFEDYSPEKEAPFARAYGTSGNYANLSKRGAVHEGGQSEVKLTPGYSIPRAYGLKPYDLDQEIKGSLDYIARFAPAGKRPRLVQWSGDTIPYEAALRAVREAGALAINGGDSRFDAEFPSHSSVPPVGRLAGKERQIYAANSNENTYTELWTGNFFRFRDLVWTIERTEAPRRLKAINVYYHMYSGEKLASLNALKANLDFVRGLEIAPIETSRYVEIAHGFYTARFERLAQDRWAVRDRGALNTIRFDDANGRAVDFARSVGVIGQRWTNGSLYVALDERAGTVEIALVPRSDLDDLPPAARPYVHSSRWRLQNVAVAEDGFGFTAQGYGFGEMTWRVRKPGRYRIETSGANPLVAEAGADGRLTFIVPGSAIAPRAVKVMAE
ncbi:MAG: hypothetical protein FJX46_15585 [Alphaproteobacteria bacterium]|nr:hypothetical protein [Alphaproteobacteria bacterium]